MAAGLPPRRDRLLAGRVQCHDLVEARHLEERLHIGFERADLHVATGGTRMLHRRHERAEPGAVDVADGGQIEHQPRMDPLVHSNGLD